LGWIALNGVSISGEFDGLRGGRGLRLEGVSGGLRADLMVDPTPGEYGDILRAGVVAGERTVASVAVGPGPTVLAGGADENYRGPWVAAITVGLDRCLVAELPGGEVRTFGQCR